MSQALGSSATAAVISPLERQTIRKVAWRLMPLLMLGYFCAYLDRVNVGYAGLQMNKALAFSASVFGFGSGIFFWGYFLFEIPSNLILARVGARLWFTRILITWGIISALDAFVWNATSFYVIRFCLGLAEAGFYPGVVYFLTRWFPSYYRSRMMAFVMLASVISLILGPIVSGQLLELDGMGGLAGWQWLFLIEGLPPIIMGIVIFFLLTDRPEEARWLDEEERAWLTERLQHEETMREAIRRYELLEALRNPRVWGLTLVYFGQNVSNYGFLIFLPQIIKAFGVSYGMTGLIGAIPFLFAAFAMLVWGWHSDYTGERVWHLAGACLLTAAGLFACYFLQGNPVAMMIALICAQMGQASITPIFWSLPTAMLTGIAAAGGIALINSVGNLGGFFGPSIYGLVKDATHSDGLALIAIGAFVVMSAVVVLALGHDHRLEVIPTRKSPEKD
jgi:ACS family tartrate transporter-like MFS transporter